MIKQLVYLILCVSSIASASGLQVEFKPIDTPNLAVQVTVPFLITKDHVYVGKYILFTNKQEVMQVFRRGEKLNPPDLLGTYTFSDVPPTANYMFRARIVSDAFTTYLTSSNRLRELQPVAKTQLAKKQNLNGGLLCIVALGIVAIMFTLFKRFNKHA